MEDKNFDELDDKTKVIISKMEKVIKDKDSEIKTKNAEIEDLKNQLAFLKGQILNKNRKIFGQSSEQASGDQLSFFNEAEKDSDSKISEPDIATVTYSRKKAVSHNGKKDNTANLKRVVIEHKLDDSKKYVINVEISFLSQELRKRNY